MHDKTMPSSCVPEVIPYGHKGGTCPLAQYYTDRVIYLGDVEIANLDYLHK